MEVYATSKDGTNRFPIRGSQLAVGSCQLSIGPGRSISRHSMLIFGSLIRISWTQLHPRMIKTTTFALQPAILAYIVTRILILALVQPLRVLFHKAHRTRMIV